MGVGKGASHKDWSIKGMVKLFVKHDWFLTSAVVELPVSYEI